MYSDQVKERSSKLEAWLQVRPREIGVAIAARSSMRALPVFWNWAESSPQAKEWQVSSLLPLWANLATWLVAMRRSENSRAMAEAASQHAGECAADFGNKSQDIENFGALHAATAGSMAALHAGEAYTPDPDKIPFLTVLYASCSDGMGQQKLAVQIYDVALRDCALIDRGKQVIYEPLWLGERNAFESDWKALSAKLGPKKSFLGGLFGGKPTGTNLWWDWYQRALDGRGQIHLENLEAMSWKIGQSFPLMYIIPSPEERAQRKA
jgi:hypothetical protein